MRTVPLGELIVPAGVMRAGESAYPVLSMTMHDGLVAQTARFKKRIASSNLSDYKVVRRGQLVVSFPIDEGVLDFQLTHDAAIVSPAYGIWDVADEDSVDRLFLKQFLRSPRAMAYYSTKLQGSTARRRSLPRDVFLELPVPLPTLEFQRHIATTLDLSDALRVKRRQILRLLEELGQAIFADMFGNPMSNDLGIATRRLGDIAGVMTGTSPPRSDPGNFGGAIEWIKSDNLGGDVATTAAEQLSELGRSRGRVAPAGSVLVTCIAGSATSIGKASLVDRDVAFNQQINAVLPSSELNSRFLLGQLKVAPGLVRAKSTGGMKGLVNKSSFQAIEILVPHRDEQDEYDRRIRGVERQADVARQALASSDELFTSVQSRAFQGDL